MLVVGGNIGLEMATVTALGSKITVVELADGLMTGCDRDLVRVLQKRLQSCCENIYTSTQVKAIAPAENGLIVTFEGKKRLNKIPSTESLLRLDDVLTARSSVLTKQAFTWTKEDLSRSTTSAALTNHISLQSATRWPTYAGPQSHPRRKWLPKSSLDTKRFSNPSLSPQSPIPIQR